MPLQCRVGDDSRNPTDDHKGVVEDVTGAATTGSDDVWVNGKKAFRVGDEGVHATCTDINQWRAVEGSSTVTINGQYAVRLGDETLHCGGVGTTVSASDNVEVGGPPANQLTLAHQNSLALLREGKRVLERWSAADQTEFERWFGTMDEAVRDEQIAEIDRAIAAIEAASNDDFRLNGKNNNASVFPSDSDKLIYLGDKWFALNETPQPGAPRTDNDLDSQASTVAHEYSHFNNVGDTDDNSTYGDDATQQLANNDPSLAQETADNFENWLEQVWDAKP